MFNWLQLLSWSVVGSLSEVGMSVLCLPGRNLSHKDNKIWAGAYGLDFVLQRFLLEAWTPSVVLFGHTCSWKKAAEIKGGLQGEDWISRTSVCLRPGANTRKSTKGKPGEQAERKQERRLHRKSAPPVLNGGLLVCKAVRINIVA